VSQLLLNTDQLCVNVPKSHSSVLRGSSESILVFRMPLTIVDGSYMSLGVSHIMNIHVSSHCSLTADSFLVIKFRLVISATAQEILSARTE